MSVGNVDKFAIILNVTWKQKIQLLAYLLGYIRFKIMWAFSDTAIWSAKKLTKRQAGKI